LHRTPRSRDREAHTRGFDHRERSPRPRHADRTARPRLAPQHVVPPARRKLRSPAREARLHRAHGARPVMRRALAIVVALAACAVTARAQRPPAQLDAAAILHQLRELEVTGTVLYVAA